MNPPGRLKLLVAWAARAQRWIYRSTDSRSGALRPPNPPVTGRAATENRHSQINNASVHLPTRGKGPEPTQN